MILSKIITTLAPITALYRSYNQKDPSDAKGGTYQKDNQVPGCINKSQEIGYFTTEYLRKEVK